MIADHRRLERRRLAALAPLAGDSGGRTDEDGSTLDPQLVAALRRLPAGERDTLLLVVWGPIAQLIPRASSAEQRWRRAVPRLNQRSATARFARPLAASAGGEPSHYPTR